MHRQERRRSPTPCAPERQRDQVQSACRQLTVWSDDVTINLVLSPPSFISSATTPPQRSVGGASTHSVSSGATPPDRLRFPRGTASRSTFHGGQLRERRTATYNGPPASPSLSHDATPLAQSRARGSTNLFSKLTSKLTRRYAKHHGRLTCNHTASSACISCSAHSFLFLPVSSLSEACQRLRETGDLMGPGESFISVLIGSGFGRDVAPPAC